MKTVAPTHGCPETQHTKDGIVERMAPCVFVKTEQCRNSERIAYRYVDCETGEHFYTYEPLPAFHACRGADNNLMAGTQRDCHVCD